MFALGLAGTLDGVRVAYTGDNLLAGALSPLRAAAPIYRNVMRLDSIRVGVERLIEHGPELLLTGHTGALEVSRQDLDEFVAWARQLELVVGRLAPVPGLEDEALDPYVARFDPYRASGRGRRTGRGRRHRPQPRTGRARGDRARSGARRLARRARRGQRGTIAAGGATWTTPRRDRRPGRCAAAVAMS